MSGIDRVGAGEVFMYAGNKEAAADVMFRLRPEVGEGTSDACIWGKAFWAEKAASIGYLRQECAWWWRATEQRLANGIGAEVGSCLSDILVGMGKPFG